MSTYKDTDKILKRLPDDLPYKASVKRVLMQAPPADVVEVRHGEWVDKKCSVCGEDMPYKAMGNFLATTFYQFKTKYCPECGAKMDGKRREQ